MRRTILTKSEFFLGAALHNPVWLGGSIRDVQPVERTVTLRAGWETLTNYRREAKAGMIDHAPLCATSRCQAFAGAYCDCPQGALDLVFRSFGGLAANT